MLYKESYNKISLKIAKCLPNIFEPCCPNRTIFRHQVVKFILKKKKDTKYGKKLGFFNWLELYTLYIIKISRVIVEKKLQIWAQNES